MTRVQTMRQHPFVFVDPERVRLRAYYRYVDRIARCEPGSPTADWLAAEEKELDLWISEAMVRPSSDCSLALEDHYDLVASHVVAIGRTGEPKRFAGGVGKSNHCDICERSSPEVTFRDDAHLIPEAFGNRTLLTPDECDRCNGLVGRTLDDHLAKMLIGDRVLSQTPTKTKGAAKAKLGKYSASVGGVPAPGPLTISVREGDVSVVLEPKAPQRLELTLPPVKYRPMSAIQAVGRMALLALPPPLRVRCEHLRKWVVGERTLPKLRYWRFFLPMPLRTTGITVWIRRRDSSDLPELIAMFHSGHSVITVGFPVVGDR